jgi:hypothetical protein
MGVSTELGKYLSIFIRATPDPRFDREIWSEMSIVKRCGRGLAVRQPKPQMSEREIRDVIGYLINAGAIPGVTSHGDLRTMLMTGFNEWPPKTPTP